MSVSKTQIVVSDDWLNELDRLSEARAQISVIAARHLVAQVRALKREREALMIELETFIQGIPMPDLPNDAMRREAWAKLGWVV